MGKIIGTPFKANKRVLKKTNKRVRGLIISSRMKKKQIALSNLKDRIEAKNLPSSRPGRIE